MAEGKLADPKKVKDAGERVKLARENELLDLSVVLGTDAGRRVIWRFMQHARVFESVWEASAKIHYNAGKQDFGHFIMAEVVAADQDKLFLMMQESKKREEKQNV